MTTQLTKRISLGIMSIFYILAGINHFNHPKFYLAMMPPFLPAHLPLIYLSGLAEIVLGFALVFRKYTRPAAFGIIALLIAVFPANFYMYQTGGAGYNVPAWILPIRLPAQALLILWAYWHTRPFKRPSKYYEKEVQKS